MAISTRTAVAAHALTFLAQFEQDGLQSSARIAESLESNPAFVRRVLGLLQSRGLVSALEGSGGGWTLARPAERITLLDAYLAAEGGGAVLPTHAHMPSQGCVIGRHIQGILEQEFAEAQRAMERRLSETTIADLRASIIRRERTPA